MSFKQTSISVDELITAYVYQFQQDRILAVKRRSQEFRSEERELNNQLERKHNPGLVNNDWKRSAEVAIEEFKTGRLMLFVGDTQIRREQEALTIHATDVVRFVYTMLLTGR